MITSDPSADTPDASRAASREGNIFRTNSYSDVEDVIPKIVLAITKGKCIQWRRELKELAFLTRRLGHCKQSLLEEIFLKIFFEVDISQRRVNHNGT